MFSVLIKPCYYLVKYRILYVLFLMIPSISSCAGEQNQISLEVLDSQYSRLVTTMENHLEQASLLLKRFEEQQYSISTDNMLATITHRNAQELLNKIKLEVLPEMSGTLKHVSDNATQLINASTTQQDTVYKMMCEWQENLNSTVDNCDVIGKALIELQTKLFYLTRAATDIESNQLSFNREAASLSSIYKEFTKLVSDFKTDVSITKNVFEDCRGEIHETTIEFQKLGDLFNNTVVNQLQDFSSKLTTDIKSSMRLTGRFNELESNLVDAVSQANLPKEFKFDTTTVVDFCKGSEVKSLKTDWNSVVDYSVLKSHLKAGFSEMSEQGAGFEDIEGLTDLSLQVLASFSFNP